MNRLTAVTARNRPGVLEAAFVILLLVDIGLYFAPVPGLSAAANLAVWILGAVVVVRLVRKNLKPLLWRLRNRLMVSYLFIAVVPIALVMLMVLIAGYILMGQMAIYAVTKELDRRSEGESQGAPSLELLSDLMPNFGDVGLVEVVPGGSPDFSFPKRGRRHLPTAANAFDIELRWFSPVTFQGKDYMLIVRSRPSAVLGTIFGQKMEWEQRWTFFAIVVASLFLIVQLASILLGASMTRTITGAVHDLYEGTQKVKEGDFSHRIAVRGGDQLAELSLEFNHMTENLQRLIVLAKERERLHSELEIAHDVQSRLFPKAALSLQSLSMCGICHPAQQVSGDYYDFLRLDDSSMALAIGDVAGKGISAALLMATIQSAMRSHLARAGPKSPAHVVSLLNRQIYASTAPEKYATFCFGLYDDTTGMLTYTNAGHLPPLLLRGGAAERLEVTGTVVGAFPAAQYEEKQIALRPGDLLVAYTDGITEPEDAYGEMFGDERLIDVLLKYRGAGSEEIMARTMEAVREWAGSPEQQDDMTMMIALRMGA